MISALSLSPSSVTPDLRMAPPTSSQSAQPQSSAGDFSSVLRGFVADSVETLRQGESAGILGVQGALPLQSVVEKVMAAERALQTGIAIRDKLVSSYLEITRMQI